MKFLSVIYLLLFFSFSAMAIGEHWVQQSKLNAPEKVYRSQSDCMSATGESCFDISGKDPRFQKVESQEVDDVTKPIYKSKYAFSNCDTHQACLDMSGDKAAECLTGDSPQIEKNQAPIPGYSIFCHGIEGYEKKTLSVLVEDADLKTSVLAAQKAKDDAAAAVKQIASDAKFGEYLIALVGARIRAKDLSLADTKLVLSEYAPLISLLRSGAIKHAKEEADGMTPDGARISPEDKTFILSELTAYLGQ